MGEVRDEALRRQLAELLDGHGAHVDAATVLGRIPYEALSRETVGQHTLWELVEHMRIAQWDILEFSRNASHRSPPFPGGYWPEAPAPPSERAWHASVSSFRGDLEAMKELVRDPANDLFEPFPHGDGQNLLREAMLVADHNAYHLGQLVQAMKALGVY